MTPIMPKKHVREKYYPQKDGTIIATTSKAGCTSVKLMSGGIAGRIRIEEAVKLRDKTEIRLYIRNPLERLVSAWAYFTGDRLVPRAYMTPEDEQVIHTCKDFRKWCDVAFKYNDEHWASQVLYHTLGDVFVPNLVVALKYLGGEIYNTTNHKPWAEYYKDVGFRRVVIERYLQDYIMWSRVRNQPEGVLYDTICAPQTGK